MSNRPKTSMLAASFRLNNLWYRDASPKDFCYFLWWKSLKAYQIYRLLLCLFSLGWFIAHLVKLGLTGYLRSFLLYFTGWFELLLNIYLTASFFVTVTGRRNQSIIPNKNSIRNDGEIPIELSCKPMDNSDEKLVTSAEQKEEITDKVSSANEAIPNRNFGETDKDQSSPAEESGESIQHIADSLNSTEELRWFHKLVWFLYEVTWTGSLVATVLYWFVVHENGTISENPYDLYEHGLNVAMLFADTVLARLPTRLLHAVNHGIVVLMYLLFSLLFSLIRYATSGESVELYIYKMLDWINYPLNGVILICMTFPVVFACQGLLVGLKALKNALYQKLRRA